MESTVDIVHAAQWAALRAWVDTVGDQDRQRPSVLDGWTVDELLSHLARSVDAIAALRPVASRELMPATDDTTADDAGDDVTLLTVADFLGGFADRKDDVAEQTRRAAAASRSDRGGELDAAFAQSQRTLSALGMSDPLVKVHGGIMQLSDFLETRIIELVLHADDLHRSLPDLPTPPALLPAAVQRAESVLRQVFLETAGVLGGDTEVARMAADEFIAVAAGRAEPPEHLPAAARSEFPLF